MGGGGGGANQNTTGKHWHILVIMLYVSLKPQSTNGVIQSASFFISMND